VGGREGLRESRTLRQALVATLVVAMFGTSLDAMADLNQIEANTWGELVLVQLFNLDQ
jgi:hypothetical protein